MPRPGGSRVRPLPALRGVRAGAARGGRPLADGDRARGPALGRHADPGAPAPHRQVGVAGGRPRRRHVPGHRRRGHRAARHVPGRPATRRRRQPHPSRGTRRRSGRTLRGGCDRSPARCRLPRPRHRAGDAEWRQRLLPRSSSGGTSSRPASWLPPRRVGVHSAATVAVVPDSVREVVAARIAKLSPPARRVIEVAAVAGQRVDRARARPRARRAGAGARRVLRRARGGRFPHGRDHHGPGVPVRACPRARHRRGVHRPAGAEARPPRSGARHRGGARDRSTPGAGRPRPSLRRRRPGGDDRPCRGVRPAGGGAGDPDRRPTTRRPRTSAPSSRCADRSPVGARARRDGQGAAVDGPLRAEPREQPHGVHVGERSRRG